MFRSIRPAALQASLFAGGALALSTVAGCASWLPVQERPRAGIADTDETLNKPMRPASPQEERLPWYDMRNILDPRSRDIERHLGV